MAAIPIIKKKANLDFSGFQTMTLSCDKNGSMLVKEKKIMVNHGIHLKKCIYFWISLCDRYVFASETVNFLRMEFLGF